MAGEKKYKKAKIKYPLKDYNYRIIGIGLGVCALGFILLAAGSTVIAPILLVLGYCAIIPFGILYRRKE